MTDNTNANITNANQMNNNKGFQPLVSPNNQPIVVISKCIEFESCRYDGKMIENEFIKGLKPFVSFVTVCPEVEIGLPIPRKTIRLVSNENKIYLIQPETKTNFTEEMNEFSEKFLKSIEKIDGFILKSNSPSCGIKDVKIYKDLEKSLPLTTEANGMFAEKVIKEYNNKKAIATEEMLNNSEFKHHFLTKLFVLAYFRNVKETKKLNKLIEFHSANKYLFMAYNQLLLTTLGNITANKSDKSTEEIFSEYEKYLFEMLEKPFEKGSLLNALMHCFGYFSNKLSYEEKAYFLEVIELFKKDEITLNMVTFHLKAWIVKFNQEYLKIQTLLYPYPEKLGE